MTVKVLRARTEKWQVSARNPAGVGDLPARSRQMFVDCYHTYENFMDAATRKSAGCGSGLASTTQRREERAFDRLIQQAKECGLVGDAAQDVLHAGRKFRNSQIHATNLPRSTRRWRQA